MGGKRTPCRLPEKSRPGSTRWQIFYFYITQYREQSPFQKQFGGSCESYVLQLPRQVLPESVSNTFFRERRQAGWCSITLHTVAHGVPKTQLQLMLT